jgi:hypothetical protein
LLQFQEKSKEVEEKHLKGIRDFLEENDIPFSNEEKHIFNISAVQQNMQIRYANSQQLKIGYKKFGYEGVDQKYAYEITKKAEDAGLRVMWWRDFEIENTRKNNVIKSYILAACGKVKNRIYARDCEIREIPAKELREFLNTNCFYGYRSASKNYGLYLKKDKGLLKKGTLVMMWSVGHAFYGKKLYDLEVIRASTILNTQVIGGASKLFEHIKSIPVIVCGGKDIIWNSLCFYVDYDHNTGKSLPVIGFEFWNYSKGGFMNLNLETGEAFNRKPAIHKTVMQWMREGKVISTPLAGVKTFVFCKDGEYSKYGIRE